MGNTDYIYAMSNGVISRHLPNHYSAPVTCGMPEECLIQDSFSDIAIPNILAPRSLGLAAGGAQDINNFWENVYNDYLPQPTDIAYEGLFYDYDIGGNDVCDGLFCTSYSHTLSPDPFSGEAQHYLSVGLRSGIEQEDFARKNLNLVIVLDVSGSMDNPFNTYSYDSPGYTPTDDDSKTKMRLANESIVGLLDRLQEGDSLGIVTFHEVANVLRPLGSVPEDTAMLKETILGIFAGGGTNIGTGLLTGLSMLGDVESSPNYENRIILLTDAMLNIGITDDQALENILQGAADADNYTSFIGIGVDFNTALIEGIGNIRGGNYYAVHSAAEFRERMVNEFDYMVSPLVFDLELVVDAPGYDIDAVYGSPDADKSTGEVMRVTTLFPSPTQDGEARGGIILLNLQDTGGGQITLHTT